MSNRRKLTTNSYNGIGVDKTLIATNTVDYAYNAADELTEETTTVGADTTSKTYAYDDNGAQTSITANNVTTPYRYDFEGKLVSVGDDTSSTRSSYLYDGDGNRLSAIVTTGGVAKTVRYLNDTNTAYVQVLEERDADGVLQARYDNGDGDTQKLYRRRESDGLYLNRWYLGDGLESTRQLVDANGVVTDSYAYDAFGTTLQRAGETENTRLYNGQQQDESGLYFLRARYYNSGNGRFLNHDPLLGNSDDPVTLHRYLYANADAINFTDPSGRSSLAETLAVTSIILSNAAVGFVGGLQLLEMESSSSQAQIPSNPYDPTMESNRQYIDVRADNSKMPQIFDLLRRFHGFGPYPTTAGVVSAVGDTARWNWNTFMGLGDKDFYVRCNQYKPSQHFFSVETMKGHPLRGHRYWQVKPLGGGILRIETAAVEKPNTWLDRGKLLFGGKYWMAEGWQSMFERIAGDLQLPVVNDESNVEDKWSVPPELWLARKMVNGP